MHLENLKTVLKSFKILTILVNLEIFFRDLEIAISRFSRDYLEISKKNLEINKYILYI